MLSWSPLARRVHDVLDPSVVRYTPRNAFGACVHTTGSGVLSKAKASGSTPIEAALAIYLAMQRGSQGYLWGGPTYVIDYDGAIYQLAPDEVLTAHCGHPHRELYLSGEWMERCSAKLVEHWRRAWPTFPSPQHLFPGRSPNSAYIGIEFVPLAERRTDGWLYTDAQHRAGIELCRDLGERHGWGERWAAGPRLVGHEDVNPIDRSDDGGGWDPGWLRARPRFDLAGLRLAI